MKKIKLLLIIVAVCVLSIGVFAACNDDVGEADKLEITQMPTIVFEQNAEEIDLSEYLDFTVKATIKGQEIILSYKDNVQKISVTGFDLKTLTGEATRTATVTYEGVSATFDYKVVAKKDENSKLFASGEGTAANPYLIKTYSQFETLKNFLGSTYVNTYFKLANDINCNEFDFSQETYFFNGSFYGTLDGGNNKLTFSADNGGYIFKSLYSQNNQGGTIKNLDVTFNGPFALVLETRADTTIENVDISGSCVQDGNNYAPYVIYNYGRLTIKDCTNSMKITGVSPYLSGFVGFANATKKVSATAISLKMINCDFAGSVFAISAAAFCSNPTTGYNYNVTFTDCKISGSVTGDKVARYFAPTNTQSSDEAVEAGTINGTSATGTIENNKLKVATVAISATTEADGTIKITATDSDVAKIAVVASFYTSSAGGTWMVQTQEFITDEVDGVYSTTWLKKLPIKGLDGSVVTENGFNAIEAGEEWEIETLGEESCYIFDNSTKVGNGYTWKIGASINPTIQIVALNANGEIIGVNKVQ